jgi:predicted nucleotidyltransferase
MTKRLPFEQIKERLIPIYEDKALRFALLFGSSVSQEAYTERSDIDLAFSFDQPTDMLALTNNVIKLLHTDNVDVVDLRRASPLLKFSAAKNGRLLYERSPGLFVTFYSLAFRMYVDTRKLRDAQAKAVNTFLEDRGLT